MGREARKLFALPAAAILLSATLGVVPGACAAGAPASASHQASATPVGRLTAVFGKATIDNGEAFHDADMHAVVNNEDRITTRGGGGATVLLASRIVLKLDDNTAVRVIESDGKTTLELETGTVHVFAGRRTADKRSVSVIDFNGQMETTSAVFLASYNPITRQGYYATEEKSITLTPADDSRQLTLSADQQAIVQDGKLVSNGTLDRIAFSEHKQSIDRLGQTAISQTTTTYRMRARTTDLNNALTSLSASGWIDATQLGVAAARHVTATDDGAASSNSDSQTGTPASEKIVGAVSSAASAETIDSAETASLTELPGTVNAAPTGPEPVTTTDITATDSIGIGESVGATPTVPVETPVAITDIGAPVALPDVSTPVATVEPVTPIDVTTNVPAIDVAIEPVATIETPIVDVVAPIADIGSVTQQPAADVNPGAVAGITGDVNTPPAAPVEVPAVAVVTPVIDVTLPPIATDIGAPSTSTPVAVGNPAIIKPIDVGTISVNPVTPSPVAVITPAPANNPAPVNTGVTPPVNTGVTVPDVAKPVTPVIDIGVKPPVDVGVSPVTDIGVKPPVNSGVVVPPIDVGIKPPVDVGVKPPVDTGIIAPPVVDTGVKPPVDTGTVIPPVVDVGVKPPVDTGTVIPPIVDVGIKPPVDTGTVVPPVDVIVTPPIDTGMTPPQIEIPIPSIELPPTVEPVTRPPAVEVTPVNPMPTN